MEISSSGHVVACTTGLPAALANVPVPSRIVSVDGKRVSNHAEAAAALKVSAAQGDKVDVVTFVLLPHPVGEEDLAGWDSGLCSMGVKGEEPDGLEDKGICNSCNVQ